MKTIQISEPNIGNQELKAAAKVLKSGNLAQGKLVEKFEKAFAAFIGTKYAIATSNGTTALHLALLALGIKKRDEVITTSFSFVASTNAILFAGAKPIFVDIKDDFNLDPKLIEEKITKKTKAILPVHLYGYPAEMRMVMEIARKHKLLVIEDAAQAHGAMIGSKMVGSFGHCNCFSFYPTKNMTTLEGGMVTTNDEILAKKIKLLRNHGSEVRYHHQLLGYNFRLTELQAALGIAQLKRLPRFNALRRRNAQLYRSLLKNISKIKLPHEKKGHKSVFHQFTIRVKERDLLKRELAKVGIQTEVYYPIPIHLQPYLKKQRIKLPLTEKLSQEVLSLPVHSKVTAQQIKFIANKIREILGKSRTSEVLD